MWVFLCELTINHMEYRSMSVRNMWLLQRLVLGLNFSMFGAIRKKLMPLFV